jgi:uroporphyrin-III C-methyltransferase/precorrin-2 dehydrogenase/sirohydrochlorin ferrochelatase
MGEETPLSQQLLPLFLNLHGVTVVVTGSGRKACETAGRLGAAGATILFVCPDVAAAKASCPDCACAYVEGAPTAEHLEGASLLVAASDDPADDAVILAAAKERGLLAASQTGGEAPGVVGTSITQARVAVGVTTSGLCTELEDLLVKDAAKVLVPELDAYAEVLGNVRDKLAERYPDMERREQIWTQMFDSPVLALLQAGDEDEAVELAERMAWGTG